MKRKVLQLVLSMLAISFLVFGLTSCGVEDHIHSYKTQVVAPTCTEEGYTLHKCDCGDKYEDTITTKLEHEFTNYVSNNDATCTKNCTETAICSREGCNETHTKEIFNSALEHEFTNYVSNNDATCKKNCTETATCSREGCNQTHTKEISNSTLEHNYVNGQCACGDKEIIATSLGLEYRLINNSTEYEVSGIGTCTDTYVIIPATYNNLPVTSIGDKAFYNLTLLTGIKIPNSVTCIGNDSFSFCTKLTNIEIPNSVTSMGKFAFYRCPIETAKVPTIAIPYITHRAAYPNETLKNVKITGGNSIEDQAFEGIDNLESIEIPDSVTSIGYKAFYDCKSLTNIEVSEENENYKDINGNLYTKDGTVLIQYATGKKDTSFKIPSSVTSIGDYAFECCALTNISIPDSVTSIGFCSFRDCIFLTSVTIGDGVTSIDDGEFIGCKSLTNIEVSEENENYKDIDGNLYTKDGSVLIRYAIGKKDTSFKIPSSVTSIGDYAFESCALTSISIPDSVTSIGVFAFYNCKNLTSVTIGDGVTSIGFYAFEGCENLTSVTIGDGVTSIGDSAFYNCKNLTSVTIGSSVTIIEDYAFGNCRNLTNVYYKGTREDWKQIQGKNEVSRYSLSLYYYVENESDLPADNGDYWHYVDGVPTPWIEE